MKKLSAKRTTVRPGRAPEFASQLNAKLAQVHADIDELEQLHQRLRGLGFSESELPAQVDRQTYCLLGEHLRPETLAVVAASEGELLEKAIVRQPLARQSTPVLRLLSIIINDLNKVQALRDRLEAGLASALSADRHDFALQLPPQTIRGLEAQLVQITGRTLGCEWLLILPDPAFGMRESLLESCGNHEFEIELPCATGSITIAGLNARGEVLRKQLQLQALPPWSDMSVTAGGTT